MVVIRFFILMLLLVFAHYTKGQMVSTAYSNYMAINAAKYNPSAIVDPRFVMDGEILGLGLHIYNNYGFFAGGLSNLQEISKNRARRFANFYNEIELGLPSVTFTKKKLSFGLMTRGRSITKGHQLPIGFANHMLEGLRYEEQFNQAYRGRNFYLKSMTWGEVGGMFGMILKQDRDYLLNGAITIKRLFGTTTVLAQLDELNYRADSFNVYVSTSSASYQYVVPGGVTGGWGADVGFTFKKMYHHMEMHTPHSKEGRCSYFEYDYKISVALLDVGRIKFNQNSGSVGVTDLTGTLQNYPDQDLSSLSGIAFTVTNQFPDADFENNSQIIGPMPTSIHVLFDKNFGSGFYAGAQMLYGFQRRRRAGADRLSFFNITGRYERKFFEAAAPITFYPYRNPRLGFMFRAYNFYLGTDNFLTLIGDMYGADIHVGFKFFLQKSKECRGAMEKIGVKPCREPNKKHLIKRKDKRKSRELF